MARLSLEKFSVIMDDTKSEEWDKWKRSYVFTEEELKKMRLEENNFILGGTKMYSITEKKFVDFNIYILVQQEDENSLLKRGVYFKIIPHYLILLVFYKGNSISVCK